MRADHTRAAMVLCGGARARRASTTETRSGLSFTRVFGIMIITGVWCFWKTGPTFSGSSLFPKHDLSREPVPALRGHGLVRRNDDVVALGHDRHLEIAGAREQASVVRLNGMGIDRSVDRFAGEQRRNRRRD